MSDHVHRWRLRFWGKVADTLGLERVTFRLVEGVWYAASDTMIARGPTGADALRTLCMRRRDV